MDYKFPQQLFPAFFNTGPPETVYKHNAGNWGSYEGIRPGHPDGGSGRLSRWTFTSRHQIRAETWLPVEPVPLPLRSPKQVFPWPSTPPDPQDFTQHMENFFMDHHLDAFGCMAEVLEENFCFTQESKESKTDAVGMWRVRRCIDELQYKKCEFSHVSQTSDSYSDLLSDVVHAVPPALLGALLHEELAEQRDRALFDESATGGALAFVPFTQSGGGASQPGCLLYPAGRASNLLNFHRVALQQPSGGPPCLDASSSKPFIFQVKGPVRQISTAAPLSDCCVAVRSNHMCGFWTLRETDEPRLRQAVHTEQPATCVSVSPHVPGEVLLTSESGAANLWTVGKGTQVIREEDSNLYFNARSKWRWCEFSAHPRVMVYADRTGVELTDMRARSGSSHTLFRVSSTSECKSGERVVLSRYLAAAHAFHHLVTTQHSAYIMDERFPCMPMLKWDHMMESPPMFCHVLPGPASSSSSSSSVVGGANSTKILLGSQRSQEITLLQCADGRAEACVRRGPPQALPRPRDSLKLLPVQIPHRLVTARSRLSAPAAGLTCVQKTGRGGADCLCVLQLTQAGDIFYQILQPQQPETGRPTPIQEEEPSPLQHGADENPSGRTKGSSASRGEGAPVTSELTDARQRSLISETSSDEDVIGPTQAAAAQQFVAETPERERRPSGEMTSDSSSDESEGKGKRWRLKRLGLDVVVNDEPELDQMGDLDTEEVDNNNNDDGDDGHDGGNPGNAEQPGPNQRLEGNIKDTGSSRRIDASDRRPAKLSDDALIVWKRWLQKLMQRSRGNRPRPRRLQHRTVNTSRLLWQSDSERRDPNEEERLQSLRRDLRQCMTRGSLLVHAATGLPPLETVPVPDPVDTEAWPDDLSRRLTVSWRGDECWKAWWEDSLGLNREAKVQALRRKRRRQKEARRASQRLELSRSFTSTVSYQTELDSFSDSAGWSSAASQLTWSDNDDFLSQLDIWSEPGTPRATASRAATPTDATPSSLPPATPQKRQHQQQHLQAAPSGSAPPDSSPAATSSERKAKRRAEILLSSLFGSEDSSQPQSFYLEEVSAVDLGPLPAASGLLGSQSSFSQRSVRADLSQGALPQSLPPSQSSLGWPGTSQSSQPKKKKSRIGF